MKVGDLVRFRPENYRPSIEDPRPLGIVVEVPSTAFPGKHELMVDVLFLHESKTYALRRDALDIISSMKTFISQ